RGVRLLARNGTFPSFSGDGKRVYFERERTKVMAVDLDTGEITELLPAQASEIGGFQVVKPRVSASGDLIAFTSDRNGRWNVWIADIEKGALIHVGKGCEPTWFPDGKSIVWIFDRNRNTSIPHFDLATRVTKTLQDIGPPRGHEYFPVISSDGKYLLFSACRDGEHSHEKANYQIYIRPLDEDDPIRITFDEFTNRWASLFVEKSAEK
ncbi:MAG: PD40 domain-containing protein, partial [Thermoplasmata archaeon]|nr:PD40 domain-containing protein [Thermoplasmata archaeon]